jgi:hypothetical protein
MGLTISTQLAERPDQRLALSDAERRQRHHGLGGRASSCEAENRRVRMNPRAPSTARHYLNVDRKYTAD